LLGRQQLGVSAKRISERLRELLGVIEQPDVPSIELAGHRLRGRPHSAACLEAPAVEAGQDSDDFWA